MSKIYAGSKPKHHYIMISIDKDGKPNSQPYFAVGGVTYEKLKNEIVLGVATVGNGGMEKIESTPKINKYSRYTPPEPLQLNQKVWRYLEYYKFDDLIRQSSLYLSRLDQFVDNLEGISPASCKEAIQIDDRLTSEQKTTNIELYEQRMTRNRTSGFVCCWHINELINTKMWNSYGNESTESIAIETSVERLFHSTKYSTVPIVFEKIRYYENPFFNQETYWFPTLFKHKIYEAECEYRMGAFISGLKSNKFIRIKINPENLISRIHLHPKASKSHIKKVKALLKLYRLNIPVVISER